jgi:putative transcriptional regulator
MNVRITYESLAAEVGLSKNALNRLAEGKTDRVEFETLDKLCDYFRCDVADLFSHEPNEVRDVVSRKNSKTRPK